MKKQDIIDWLESEIQSYPIRSTGNECEDYVVQLARRVLPVDRSALVDAMRDWILQRGLRTLLAVQIAASLGLHELENDVECLIEDVRSHKVFLPYYEEFLSRWIKRLKKHNGE